MRILVVLAAGLFAAACGGDRQAGGTPPGQVRPWILLVTLDTTRADAIGPESARASTPSFNAIAARGIRFRQAYATAPETLPSHGSMLSGLYPAGHGVHENGRTFPQTHPVVAGRLQSQGYRTAAFVSAYVLARRFGLARGFETYDDHLSPGALERSARETTDRAITYLSGTSGAPQFVWVHYFDPHTPYAPPDPFASGHGDAPYFGEIEAMDAQLGRLIAAFDQAAARNGAPGSIVLAGDHGEGLGEHGEQTHGHLLYQSTMHVPLVVTGPGISPGVNDASVSVRRVYHTLLDLAGVDPTQSLRTGTGEVALGEAMKPYLSYGWQPQIMAVSGMQKAIFAGRLETYDLARDPSEQRSLGAGTSLPSEMRRALDDYPIPSLEPAQPAETISEEARRNLASLGYVSGTATPVVRGDAPRPVEMVDLFPIMEEASTRFVQGRYADAIPLLQRILERDPGNLDAVLRLATSYSSLGRDAQALEAFRRAAAIAPKSDDARLYLALHYVRGKDWRQAVPILERIVGQQPDRLAALEGLASVRERQGRLLDAVRLRQRTYGLRDASTAEWVSLGELAMAAGETNAAIEAFQRARSQRGGAFRHDLELGVLLLAARRLPEARDALDRVSSSHPEYPMALFKRAQVSVLLNEPDRADRIALARKHADRVTRPLIAQEKLFEGVRE